MMSSLQLLVLLSLSFTKANDCNVFSSQFENRRCSEVYKAVENALWSNDVNKYILDEAFSLNNYHHLPTKIIITVQGAI